jgi:polyhydroxyalkanoate synthesis regulator phasin
MMRAVALGLFLLAIVPAGAQDIRGLENCATERQMERRTGCLQANVEYLQRSLAKVTREMQQQIGFATGDIAAAKRDAAALRSDVAALKEALAKLQTQVEELQKGKSGSK